MTSLRARASGFANRRHHQRIDADRQFILISVANRIDGVMQNLSRHGARVTLRDVPPRRGRDVLLRWGPHEVFGHIVWASGSEAGISFHKPMTHDELVDTVGEVGVETLPVGRKVI